MMSNRRSQLILAGIILGGLALLSLQTPSLTPWFVGWLLAGIALSFAYKRREARLIGASVLVIIVLAAVGVYPRWRGAMQQVTLTSSYGVARELSNRLSRLSAEGPLPAPTAQAWQDTAKDLQNPYRRTPIAGQLEVVALPHRAGLITAGQTLPADTAKAGDLTVFVAENRFFVVVPRDDKGAPLPFSEEFSNLKTSKTGAGEARAVDKSIPGNQPQDQAP
jgi:type II secretory pathway pseudopilin PulG